MSRREFSAHMGDAYARAALTEDGKILVGYSVKGRHGEEVFSLGELADFAAVLDMTAGVMLRRFGSLVRS